MINNYLRQCLVAINIKLPLQNILLELGPRSGYGFLSRTHQYQFFSWTYTAHQLVESILFVNLCESRTYLKSLKND
jgi:hypothetical protein